MFTLTPQDTHLTVTLTENVRNTTTGALARAPMTGRTDVSLEIVLPDIASGVPVPVAGTEIALVEATADNGVYYGTYQRTTLVSTMADIPNGATIGYQVTVGEDRLPVSWGQWRVEDTI